MFWRFLCKLKAVEVSGDIVTEMCDVIQKSFLF
jgi:hypothetical protein